MCVINIEIGKFFFSFYKLSNTRIAFELFSVVSAKILMKLHKMENGAEY